MNKRIITLAIAASFLVGTSVQAGMIVSLTERYGINVIDYSDLPHCNAGTPLYQFANTLLGLNGANVFTSSNHMFDTIGVSPTTQWQASSDWEMLQIWSSHVGFGHELSIIDQERNTHALLNSRGAGLNATGVHHWQNDGLPTGPAGMFDFALSMSYNNRYVYTLSSNFAENDFLWNGNVNPNPVQMLAFDITAMFNATNGTDFESVFMFGWEDQHSIFHTGPGGHSPNSTWRRDNDYNDVVFIIANIRPVEAVIPEPATLAIMGLGLAGLGLVRASRRRK